MVADHQRFNHRDVRQAHFLRQTVTSNFLDYDESDRPPPFLLIPPRNESFGVRGRCRLNSKGTANKGNADLP